MAIVHLSVKTSPVLLKLGLILCLAFIFDDPNKLLNCISNGRHLNSAGEEHLSSSSVEPIKPAAGSDCCDRFVATSCLRDGGGKGQEVKDL